LKLSKAEITKIKLLEAAKIVLLEKGYQNLTTRAVAEIAGSPMSQIQYHFGSKDKMILDLFDYMNRQLIDRQTLLFSEDPRNLAHQWEKACDYLDEDLESGYVRVLQELLAAGWSNPEIGEMIRQALKGWNKVLMTFTLKVEQKYGPLKPFSADEVVALISCAFIGAEAMILLGLEDQGVPFRKALRRFGELIYSMETDKD